MQKPYKLNLKDSQILSPEEIVAFKKEWETLPVEHRALYVNDDYNKPEHYHNHEIDTITFLQKGFPPEVCMGFFKGSIVKYTQRADYKNGREDYLKIVDFAKRMLDWYDKTHS